MRGTPVKRTCKASDAIASARDAPTEPANRERGEVEARRKREWLKSPPPFLTPRPDGEYGFRGGGGEMQVSFVLNLEIRATR